MFFSGAPSQLAQAEAHRRRAAAPVDDTRTVVLAVASKGALVARTAAACRVHSTFAGACNLLCAGMLLGVVGPAAGGGPANIVLRHAPPCDLRRLFQVGETLRWGEATLRSRRAVLDLAQAAPWQPKPRRALLPSPRIESHLAFAARRLAACRSGRPSVIDGAGVEVVEALTRATRHLDQDAAARRAGRLVGWGEGLTPAGDDFLVGWLAALDRLANDARRLAFFAAVANALALLTPRTTPIAAQFLRFAAQRQHVEVLDTLLDALLCGHRGDLMEHALENALAVGATSGADLVSGVLAGLAAWLPATGEA